MSVVTHRPMFHEERFIDAEADRRHGPQIWLVVEDLLGEVARTIVAFRRPRATYRVQFNADLTFRRAADWVEYWGRLGVSDCYASPLVKSMPGSRHGYDTVDYSQLNPDLGSPSDFVALDAKLRAQGMGLILDFVPNHMGIASDANALWRDVLESGPGSQFATFFDIDWHPLKPDLECKVLLPVLSDQYGRILEEQQLLLGFENGEFFISYFERRFPIAPHSFGTVLRHRWNVLAAALPETDPHLIEFQSILTAIGHLPELCESDPARLEEGRREKVVVKRRLHQLCQTCPAIHDFVYENVRIFNGRQGDTHSFDLLDELLQKQAYRLSYWRVAADEINYRRFFDVNELAAICMERPEVFELAHELVFRLLAERQAVGLRVDHADGLYNPAAYFWQLQERRLLQLCRAEFERRFGPPVDTVSGESAASPSWAEVEIALRRDFALLREFDPGSPLLQPLFLLVEKILGPDEQLPDDWPVAGETGYKFMNEVNGLFIEQANERVIDAAYTRCTGWKTPFEELAYECKLLILNVSMSSELNVLGSQLDRISERNRWSRDFTLRGLTQALGEVAACFPVYRTYTVEGRVLERDRRYIAAAVAQAKRRNPAVNSAVFDFIGDVLTLRNADTMPPDEFAQIAAFVGRFQQFTGPLTAKAVEDTAFYRFHRLTSLNEVGGDPQRFGMAVEEFHEANQARLARRPFGMLATSTHDTKRSEDVRARINVLSELPTAWKQHVSRWYRVNKHKKAKFDGQPAPSRNDEYLLYQTLVGAWPLEQPRGAVLTEFIARIQEYMVKAVREAKVHSSWIAPNDDYERELKKFIAEIIGTPRQTAFRRDFEPFARQIAACGMWNSLSQSLLKMTSPGVPDIYQGTELWDFSLVDPDNRRNVDFEARRFLLDDLQAALATAPSRLDCARRWLDSPADGRLKLYVITEVLQLRRKNPDLFTTGDYVPLTAVGVGQKSVCAFARRASAAAAIVVAPRLTAGLGASPGAPPISRAWRDTALRLPDDLAEMAWSNIYTGESINANSGAVQLADVLASFPVAVLVSRGERRGAVP